MLRNINIDNFSGIDNVNSEVRLPPSTLKVATNVEISNDKIVRRRKGYTKKATGSFHSLWASRDICLAVEDDDLVRVATDYTTTVLRQSVGTNRMAYVDVNGVVYYTNGTVSGRIEDGIDGDGHPVAGQLIEFYKGVLMVAKDDTLWRSDAMNFRTIRRLEKNYTRFDGRITMLAALEGGFYVSAGGKTMFISGPVPEQYVSRVVADHEAIENTVVKTGGTRIGTDIISPALIWTSRKGVCIGMGDGTVMNVTDQKYNMPNIVKGAATLRSESGENHYITVVEG